MPVSASLGEKFLLPDSLLNEELSFLLKPVLLRGKVATLFSPAGTGKSTFIYNISYELLKKNICEKVVCYFSDADATNDEFKRLVSEYFDRSDVEKSRFIPIFPDGSEFFKAFRKDVENGTLKKDSVELVIIDSLEQFAELCGIDFHRSVGRLYALFRKMTIQGITVLILHHTNKGGQEFSGRSVIINQSDVVYRLRRAGRFKWYLDSLKHRGGKLLNGRLDYYVELEDGKIVFYDDILDDKYGYVVHLIKEVLRDKGICKQYEVIKEVKVRAENEVGVRKIREALAKYEGIFWWGRRGDKNALEYELIVQVKVEEKDQDRDKILSEIEEMIKKKILFADDMPPLLYNGKEYKVFTDIAKDIPTSVLKEYLQRIKGEFAGVEEVAEDF